MTYWRKLLEETGADAHYFGSLLPESTLALVG